MIMVIEILAGLAMILGFVSFSRGTFQRWANWATRAQRGCITILPILVVVRTGVAATLYVSPTGSHTPPFTNWVEAATNIQSAIDQASPGDFILVTNGTYNTGGKVALGNATTNRVAVDKAVTVQSVNGPAVTQITGHGPIGNSAVRCVFVADGATLNGFTLAGGYSRNSGSSSDIRGGGVYAQSDQAVISNCVIVGNRGHSAAGGAYGGTYVQCLIVSNEATLSGGGAYAAVFESCEISYNKAGESGGGLHSSVARNCLILANNGLQNCGGAAGCTLINCTVVGNSGGNFGGGVCSSVASNSIVQSNSSGTTGPNYSTATLTYCNANPLASGTGNIDTDSLFEGVVSNNFRLKPGSPCIDSASDAGATAVDIQGLPRNLDGNNDSVAHVDMGAYEFAHPYVDTDGDGLGNAAEVKQGTRLDVPDTDGDGLNDGDEVHAGTAPGNGESYFIVAGIVSAPTSTGTVVTVETQPSRHYVIQFSDAWPATSAVWVGFARTNNGFGSWQETNSVPSLFSFTDDYGTNTTLGLPATDRRSYRIKVSNVVPPFVPLFPVWINEFHYDNTNTDVSEGVEVAGVAGTDLSTYRLYFYDSGGGTYKNSVLSGVIDNEFGGYGAVWFAVSAIQNGPADAVALVKNLTNVLQFISYEGTLTATNGPAIGVNSTDAGVLEDASPIDQSLQLSGIGRDYPDFSWIGPQNHSRSNLNSAQLIAP